MAAGYIRPSVLVIQEIRTASPPLILPDQKVCIVGPAYQIVRDKYAGAYTPGGVTLPVPDLITGAIVDTNTLKVVIKNAEVDKVTLAGISITAGSDSYTDATVNFETLGVKPGDVFVAGNFRTQIIKVSGNTIYFADTVKADLTNVTAYIREFITFNVLPSDVTYNQTKAELTINVSNAIIYSGQIFVSYKAIRADIANKLLTFSSINDVELQLGEISLKNPLAYAVAKTLANTVVSVFAMPIESDDFNGYANAMNALAAEDVYFIVPLTQDPAVIGLLKSQVEALSKPEVKKWRVAIVAPELPEEVLVTSGTGDLTNGVLYDPNAKFLETIGNAQDYSYYLKVNGNYYKIAGVINNNKLQLEVPYPPDAVGANYEVVLKVETKVDRLKILQSIIPGIKSRRIVAIFPDVVVDEDGNYVPSYYAAAAVAGMLSGLPPHKPATYMGIGGFTRTPYTDGSYFTEDELNEIAGYGYLILTQDSRTAPIYIRHQITTDDTSDYTRELSAVRTVDYLSVVFEQAIKPFIGRFNLIDEVIYMIKETIKSTANMLMSYRESFIGSPLLSYTLESVEKLNDTTLDIGIRVQIPMPLNYVFLRIIV
ncbi:MAG: hypothetical protein DSY42_09395 [Aquifex sp.]|nr:MAG: hypothetical protein DSY42_09395 [Aquifex sp.]